MGIVQFFKKLVGGKTDEPLSDYERLTRGVVRTGNLDWSGKPIDRDRGAGMLPPKGYRKMVDAWLERAGLHIERRDPPRGVQSVAGLAGITAVFERDCERQEATRWRQPPADAWLRQGGSEE
jgi:hypothetical protein